MGVSKSSGKACLYCSAGRPILVARVGQEERRQRARQEPRVCSFRVSAMSSGLKMSNLLHSSRRCKIAFRAGMRTFVELVSKHSPKGCSSTGTAFEPFSMLADFKTCSN